MKKGRLFCVMLALIIVLISSALFAAADLQAWIGYDCVTQSCGGYYRNSADELIICPKTLWWCPGSCYQCISLTVATFCYRDCNTSDYSMCWIPLPGGTAMPQSCGLKYKAKCYKDVYDNCKCPTPGSGDWTEVGPCTISLCN